jgi:hypothetical protein
MRACTQAARSFATSMEHLRHQTCEIASRCPSPRSDGHFMACVGATRSTRHCCRALLHPRDLRVRNTRERAGAARRTSPACRSRAAWAGSIVSSPAKGIRALRHFVLRVEQGTRTPRPLRHAGRRGTRTPRADVLAARKGTRTPQPPRYAGRQGTRTPRPSVLAAREGSHTPGRHLAPSRLHARDAFHRHAMRSALAQRARTRSMTPRPRR